MADYKANRVAMPDDLASRSAGAHEACEALGVPIITAPGYEADDVIGTIARRASETGFDVAIVSIDKDLFQLHTTAFVSTIRVRTERGLTKLHETSSAFSHPGWYVLRSWATPATTWRVCPVGKKGAIDLITAFGSLDALLDQAGDLTQRKHGRRSSRTAKMRSEVASSSPSAPTFPSM